MGWRFELAVGGRPPSVNDLYGVAPNGHRFLKSKGRRFQKRVANAAAGKACVGGSPRQRDRFRVHIEVGSPPGELWLWDVDNTQKIVIDAVCARLGLDDRYLVGGSYAKVVSCRSVTVVRFWQADLAKPLLVVP